MMKEQKETIERLNRFKSIKVLYGNTFAMTTEQLKILQDDIETVLNMLKEKDAEIEKLKQALARNIAKNFTSIMKESAKSKEDLEMLNAGWQIELEKKDKIIDLMAEYLDGDDTSLANYLYKKNGKCNKEMIKQYFERKVKE